MPWMWAYSAVCAAEKLWGRPERVRLLRQAKDTHLQELCMCAKSDQVLWHSNEGEVYDRPARQWYCA